MASKIIEGWVRDARYFEEEKSLVLALEEIESRKPLKPIQVSVIAFSKAMNLSISPDDKEAWRFFAKQLIKRQHPLKVEFEDSDSTNEKG